MNENDSLHLRRIKLPRQKKGGPVIFTETWFANLVAQLLESFANLKIVQGTTDGQNILSSIEAQIEHGEFGGTITLPPAFDTTVGAIGGSGGNTIQLFAVVSDGGTFLNCTSGGQNYQVIKPPKLQTTLAGETIRGVTYSYAYVATGTQYYTRNVSGSDGSSESDLVIPDYLAGNTIIGVQIGNNWYDLNMDGRAWAAQ